MKRLFFVFLSVLPFFISAQTATIKIDVDRKIGEIDPKIYGVFRTHSFQRKENGIATNIISSSGEFAGKAEVSLFNSTNLNEAFTFDKQNQYKPMVKEIKTDKNKIFYSFPAHSYTQIKVIMKK